MESDASFKTRINGSLLSQFKGRSVCLLGEVITPDASGMSFKIKTPDNVQVIIQLLEPLQEPVEGVVEIHGIVKNDKLISCKNYIQFPSEYTNDFDMQLYNNTIQKLNQNPQLYSHSG